MSKFLSLLILFLSCQAIAQDVRNASGALMGRWSGNEYRDASGRLEIRADSDLNIRDASGRLVFRMKNNDVRDASGRLEGRISGNDIRDSSGRLLGRISSDGDVRDSSGKLLGRAKGIPIEKAALVFFFL